MMIDVFSRLFYSFKKSMNECDFYVQNQSILEYKYAIMVVNADYFDVIIVTNSS